MKKLLYPLVIMVVVVVYAKTASHMVGQANISRLAGMLVTDLDKVIDGAIGAVQGLIKLASS